MFERFLKYFMKYFRVKKIMKFYITSNKSPSENYNRPKITFLRGI